MHMNQVFSFASALFFAGISFAQQTEFTGFTTDKFKFHSIHLQGIDCDETGIYFGFGNGVTKTDWKGKVIAESASAYEKGGHIGDVCVHKGKLYATSWIQPKGKGVNGREGLIQVFDAATLKPLFDENKKLPYATDGITFYEGNFWIGKPYRGPSPHTEMTIAVWDENFSKEIATPVHQSDGTKILYTMQTLEAMGDLLWHGCYVDKKWYSKQKKSPKSQTYLTDRDGKIVCASKVWASTGIAVVPKSIAGDRTMIITAGNSGRDKAWVAFYEYKDGQLVSCKAAKKAKKK